MKNYFYGTIATTAFCLLFNGCSQEEHVLSENVDNDM